MAGKTGTFCPNQGRQACAGRRTELDCGRPAPAVAGWWAAQATKCSNCVSPATPQPPMPGQCSPQAFIRAPASRGGEIFKSEEREREGGGLWELCHGFVEQWERGWWEEAENSGWNQKRNIWSKQTLVSIDPNLSSFVNMTQGLEDKMEMWLPSKRSTFSLLGHGGRKWVGSETLLHRYAFWEDQEGQRYLFWNQEPTFLTLLWVCLLPARMMCNHTTAKEKSKKSLRHQDEDGLVKCSANLLSEEINSFSAGRDQQYCHHWLSSDQGVIFV